MKGISSSFMGVLGYLKAVQQGCQESINGVLRVFQGSFQSVSRKVSMVFFKKVSRMLQGRLMGVSRIFSVGFMGI